MSSALLRKAVDKTEAMDSALKWSLLERVNDCVKELQLKTTSERSNALVNDEATNSFIWAMEAIFIHGLSNSFLKATSPFASILNSFSPSSSSASGARSDNSPSVPNPSFWEFALVFLHRDIIDQINSLHLIHTDVGRCRAWLRIALNEGLLQSFLENMTLKSNRRCLKAFYRSSAFLRDSEKCDILKNYLMGIELLDFRLVINNSFLNHWNSGPLSLVGLWVDENESVAQGVDVAKNIESKEFQAISKIQQHSMTSGAGTPPRFYSELDSVLRKQPTPLLNEDDALRIILGSSPLPSSRTPSSTQTRPTPSSSMRKSPTRRSPRKHDDSNISAEYLAQHASPQLVGVVEAAGEAVEKVTEERSAVSDDSLSQPQGTNAIVVPSLVLNDDDSPQQDQVSSSVKDDAEISPVPGITNQLLQMSSPPDPTKMCSSPADGLQSQMEISVSSIELDSPAAERSYTDLLLQYQETNNLSQQQHQVTVEDFSINNTTTSESVVSSQGDKLESSVGGSSGKSQSSKVSTTGSLNTTSTSGGLNQSRFIKFSRVTKTLHSVDDGFELISAPRAVKEVIMELLPRITKYTKVIPNENGLDTQNYACKMCSTSIGMIYGPAYLCNFTGALYCSSCHTNQEKVIPSRILLNWDFGLYPVCKQAYDYIEDLNEEAIFDVQEINPSLYREIDEFSQVKALRTQLFYIGMYLKTCKNTKALEEMMKEVTAVSKGHLLNSIHMYSLSDLLGIPNRTLANLLTKLVSTGSAHILSCTICREKGFICECCRSPQVIFPFELKKIFKCNECGAVYHNTCMSHEKNCPRCERWKKNETAISLDENENAKQAS